MKKHVVILGGGACGLSAAWELAEAGQAVTVVERAPLVGGLAGCVEHGGNRYEYGTHVFHTDQPELLSRVTELMGDEIFPFKRGSKLEIKFLDKYYPFPLNGIQVIRNLPPLLGLKCVLSFLRWLPMSLQSSRAPANTEEYLVWHFGRKLYELFFQDYTHKFWGLPCSELDPKFGQDRIPRSDIFRVVHDLVENLGLQRLVNRHPLVERSIGDLYYSDKSLQHFFQCIADRVLALGGTIHTGTEALRVATRAGRFQSVTCRRGGEEFELEADALISTIPVNAFAAMIDCVPGDVLDAAGKLRHLPLTVCGLHVDRPSVRDKICTYYRDKIFNRLSEPTNHGLRTTRPGTSLLLAEMTPQSIASCGVTDKADLPEVVWRQLAEEGLVGPGELLDHVVFGYASAYPIYLLGYREHLARCKGFLDSLAGLQSTGRQGDFVYVNLHHTMRMGIEAARRADQAP